MCELVQNKALITQYQQIPLFNLLTYLPLVKGETQIISLFRQTKCRESHQSNMPFISER